MLLIVKKRINKRLAHFGGDVRNIIFNVAFALAFLAIAAIRESAGTARRNVAHFNRTFCLGNRRRPLLFILQVFINQGFQFFDFLIGFIFAFRQRNNAQRDQFFDPVFADQVSPLVFFRPIVNRPRAI